MPSTQFDEWKRAYNLLGVPHGASPESIKQCYQNLTARWQPDRYQVGSSAYAEAADMTSRIGAAYSLIAEAPLRFYDESSVAVPTQSGSVPAYTRPDPYANEFPEISPTFQRLIDYGTRFFFGAVFGVAVAFGVITRYSRYTRYGRELSALEAALVAAAVIIGCGLAAAFLGDKFWSNVGSRRGRWLR